MKYGMLFLVLVACTPASILIESENGTQANNTLIMPLPNETLMNATLLQNITVDAGNQSEQTKETLPMPQSLQHELLPDFEFIYPVEGSKIKGEVVSVSLRLHNFTIGQIKANNSYGYGHFHYYLNNESYQEMEDASKTIRKLPKGQNKLSIEMAQNDHTSYGVKHSVIFEAQTVTGKHSD